MHFMCREIHFSKVSLYQSASKDDTIRFAATIEVVSFYSYVRLDQLIRIAHEKRKTRPADMYGRVKCKTKYLFEIKILVVIVYFWLDQLICIAREKCQTKYMLEIMMLVVVVSYLWLEQLIPIAREKCKTKY
ncbi:hypothetical protein DPMN_113754 [Dreissena polymorpha]|uniref:Uncharacterized protein n=1 Tax=Dreissena polymorpha TaxID=45954 RepID=A0A9D4KHZ5_DREPO|nr:hypothetical protein DPMN_113754 [Dreissena polymorpha]